MTNSDLRENTDPVSLAIQQANRLLECSPRRDEVDALLDALAALSPRDLARFDWQSRSWMSGVTWKAVEQLRWPLLRGARKPLWHALALVSGDGYERERAIKSAPVTRLHVQLLVLRCLDWVAPVREAALARLDDIDDDLLVGALPLAETLAAERHRGHILEALLDARLTDDHLRLAGHRGETIVRRAAWRRLADRGSLTVADLNAVAGDGDVVVRSIASRHLPSLPEDHRRWLAGRLLDDPVGSVATPALATLVALDGDPVVIRALTARTATVRRAARDWARLRSIDARAVYRDVLANNAMDAVALIGLAELADPVDCDRFHAMVSDTRTRIAAAGLRALARVDERAGRAAAVDALRNRPVGRVTWAAADVLRGSTPGRDEAEALAAVARDPQRPIGHRFRALSLLRPLRWLHLIVLLEIRAGEKAPRVRRRLDMEVDAWLQLSGRIGRGPNNELAPRLSRLLPSVDEGRRERIEFILRTSSA